MCIGLLHDVTIINVLCVNSYSSNTKFPKKFVKWSDGAQNSTLYTINAFCAQVSSNFHSITRDAMEIAASRVMLWKLLDT